MAQTALLVSEQRFKTWTNVDDNVKTEDITPFIIQAQDLYVQSALGTLFYTRLKNGIIAGDLTTDEKSLVTNYVGPMLMQWALYLMLPGLKYKLVDKGVVSGQSEDTTPTTLEELKYLRQSVMDTAEFYTKRLVEFLCDNPNMFTEYTNPGVKGMTPDKSSPYFSGLVIPKYLNPRYVCNCNDGCENCGYTNIN